MTGAPFIRFPEAPKGMPVCGVSFLPSSAALIPAAGAAGSSADLPRPDGSVSALEKGVMYSTWAAGILGCDEVLHMPRVSVVSLQERGVESLHEVAMDVFANRASHGHGQPKVLAGSGLSLKFPSMEGGSPFTASDLVGATYYTCDGRNAFVKNGKLIAYETGFSALRMTVWARGLGSDLADIEREYLSLANAMHKVKYSATHPPYTDDELAGCFLVSCEGRRAIRRGKTIIGCDSQITNVFHGINIKSLDRCSSSDPGLFAEVNTIPRVFDADVSATIFAAPAYATDSASRSMGMGPGAFIRAQDVAFLAECLSTTEP